jgi:uncharacterized Tic20 family protein
MEQTSQTTADYPLNERGRAFAPDISDDEKTWALFSHLSLLAHLVIPFFAIAIPIVIWATKKESSSFVDDHARESINFQITLTLYHLIAIPLAIITCGVGALLVLVAYVLGVIGMIMAAMAANRGEFYRYPMTFRFIH